MKEKVAKSWVKALRSGKYKQAKGKLFDGEGYCCLGVLCKVLGLKFKKMDTTKGPVFTCEGEAEVLPLSVIDLSGMGTKSGRIGMTKGLADYNDRGKDFNFIADIIENNVDKL